MSSTIHKPKYRTHFSSLIVVPDNNVMDEQSANLPLEGHMQLYNNAFKTFTQTHKGQCHSGIRKKKRKKKEYMILGWNILL